MTRGETEASSVDLSVILAARNAEATLKDQLEALVEQSWDGSWEVIVADNGSTDRTPAIVAEFAESDDRIRMIEAVGGLGAGFARNVAMDGARGRSFAFCDADDVVEPGWVAAMGEALREHPFVAGPIDVDLLNPEWIRTAYYSKPPRTIEKFAGVFPFGSTCNLGVRREVVDRIGGFDVEFLTGQDLEFCLRAWAAGVELHYLPDAVVQYRYRASMSGLWKRSRQYGAVGPAIARRLADLGCQTPSHWYGLKQYLWLVRKLPTLRTKAGRARWIVVAGTKVGRLRGSIRARWLYL